MCCGVVLRDAIAANAGHGRKFDAQDRTKCAVLLERQGVPREEIAVALRTTTDHVEHLLVRVVVVKGEKQPAKPVAWPKKGEKPRRLTVDQYETMKSSSGWRTKQTVTQLTKELRTGVVDLSEEGLVAALGELRDAIDEATKAAVVRKS